MLTHNRFCKASASYGPVRPSSPASLMLNVTYLKDGAFVQISLALFFVWISSIFDILHAQSWFRLFTGLVFQPPPQGGSPPYRESLSER